jgi:hypothetical protein
MLARETLGLRRHEGEPLEHDVARVGVEVFCLGETVAVPLFAELRRDCVAPSARRALDRILRDEVRHRDFGWTLLGWLMEHPLSASLKLLVERELPSMLQRLRRSYAPAAARSERTIAPAERAWGLMPMSQYGDILEKAVARDYVPRFARVGIDAKAAWERSGALRKRRSGDGAPHRGDRWMCRAKNALVSSSMGERRTISSGKSHRASSTSSVCRTIASGGESTVASIQTSRKRALTVRHRCTSAPGSTINPTSSFASRTAASASVSRGSTFPVMGVQWPGIGRPGARFTTSSRSSSRDSTTATASGRAGDAPEDDAVTDR